MERVNVKNLADRVRENIARVIIGKDEEITLLLTAVICRGHVLMEDVPGTGKTVMAKSLAKSIDCSFSRIQFTPDLLPGDVTGMSVYDARTAEFVFRPGPVFTNILLADEINRATPRTQSALLECMEERHVTMDGVTRRLDEPFLVVATQNPIETQGTFPLPEAQLDRFLIKMKLGQLSQVEMVKNDRLQQRERDRKRDQPQYAHARVSRPASSVGTAASSMASFTASTDASVLPYTPRTTTRCASTGIARCFTSSGVTKSRP